MDKEQTSQTKDTLMGVLSYIDSPFKLFVVLLLGLVGFAGYFIYTHQGVMIGAYMQSRELPKLDDSRFDDAAAMLFKETGAEVVSIFTVDPILNKRVLVRAYTKTGGRQKSLEGVDIKLFSNNASNNNDVIKLMNGELPCGPYTRPRSVAGLFYISQGAQYSCRVSSPSAREQFVGQITAGWVAEPDLEHARAILTIVADMLVKSK
jgi:hypothetical protein